MSTRSASAAAALATAAPAAVNSASAMPDPAPAPGSTTTYSALAERLGVKGAARAVGSACGDNPVALVVPCHRVVKKDGGMGGYRWGIERKQKLLVREAERQRRPSR